MSRFTLTIDCDNEAFEPNPAAELRRILRDLGDSQRLYEGIDPADRRYGANEGSLRDGNGNTVGGWRFDNTPSGDDEDHGPGCDGPLNCTCPEPEHTCNGSDPTPTTDCPACLLEESAR